MFTSSGQNIVTSFSALNGRTCPKFSPIECVEIALSFGKLPGKCRWKLDDKAPVVDDCVDFVVPVFDKRLQVFAERNDSVVDTEIVLDKRVLFLALGDSYASGEGMGYWLSEPCRRSVVAWPTLLAMRYAIENSHTQVFFRSAACSGAKATEVLSGGQRAGNTKPFGPQVDQLAESICGSRDKQNLTKCAGKFDEVYVMLSAGGNDMKFGRVVSRALLGDIAKETGDGTFELDDELAKSIETALRKTLPETYKSLASVLLGSIPNAQVFITTYPSPIHKTASEICDKTPFHERSNKNFEITSDEFKVMFDQLLVPMLRDDGLPAIMKAAVSDLPRHMQDRWNVVQLARLGVNGELEPDNTARGFCVTGEGRNGTWFRVFSDSLVKIGTRTGTAHPNLLGQLYYAHRVYSEMFK